MSTIIIHEKERKTPYRTKTRIYSFFEMDVKTDKYDDARGVDTEMRIKLEWMADNRMHTRSIDLKYGAEDVVAVEVYAEGGILIHSFQWDLENAAS